MTSTEAPLAIEVRNLHKRFRVPTDQEQTVRARLRHPFKHEHRMLDVLHDISFDVHQGEFFGVIGRNGSGKSTLLKILASVYGSDSGRIRIAGRLAPFLELGVGFNPQLPARENVTMNAVMMGLTSKEAAARADEMIDFAGLREFSDLRLKNYSSGMKVRLAFSVLTQVDADVLLLDEVLAVGDSEFQQKCEDAFTQIRREGKTIVLVTHSMPTVNAFCDRALLLDDGHIAAIGSPIDVSNQYLEVNMRATAAARGDEYGAYAARFADVIADPPVRIVDAWLSDAAGDRCTSIDVSEPIVMQAELRVSRRVERPGFQFRIDNVQGQPLFSGGSSDLDLAGGAAEAGEHLRVKVRVENRLAPGRYVFSGGVAQRLADGSTEPATPVTGLNFEVMGAETEGAIALDHEVTLERVGDDEPAVR